MPSINVNSVFASFAAGVVRFRVPIVIFWILAAIVAGKALPSLSSEVNNENSAFLPSSAASSKASELAKPIFGSDSEASQVTIVASREGGRLTPADQAAVSRVRAAAPEVKGVISSREAGVSKDGQASQIQVRAEIGKGEEEAQEELIESVRATFAASHPPQGLQLNVAGPVATAVAEQENSNNSSKNVQKFSILFIIILLLIVFRAPLAAVVTLLPSVVALLISDRLIGGLGEAGLKISFITQVLLIILLLGAGTDYGLFLVFRVREELRGGADERTAVISALVRVGESIAASAGTVILALLTLLLAGFALYKDLAIPLALGVLVMVSLGLTLLPALLAIFGRAVFWPNPVRPGPHKDGWWSRIAASASRRPGLTLALGVTMFGALALVALGYSSSGFGGSTAPSGSDAAKGEAALEAHFPKTSSNPANLVLQYPQPIWEEPGQVATAGESLEGSGEFAALTSPLDPNGEELGARRYAELYAELGPPGSLPPVAPPGTSVSTPIYNAYRASSPLVSNDGKTIQFEATLKAGDQESNAAMDATPQIREVVTSAAHRSGAADSGVAGQAAASYDISNTANHDLKVIIPVAVIAISLLLALVLRSLVAPVYLIVSVVLSYLAALGLATLVFIDIGGESGISFLLPFLMFVFLLALGEDYNILVMTRIREEARELPLREAVVKAIGRTGSTITSAGLILGGSFAVLAVAGGSGSKGTTLREIGFGLAFGILMDTFLVRTLLVPSMVILLGRWNWWPSTMTRADAAGSDPAGSRLPVPPTPAEGSESA
jgi:RND superfamily putative drug exporter